ncbi:Maf family protein [Celerinatantimonas yamalensis]|uniref:dTTP/UTP pyrophosphatase n=1 Tax=Celerinatantimonas yamalensis TaxID=559956 RepID=A0ABW9GE01_9GAMM
MDFYLASTSPRRQELLRYLDYQFAVIDGQIDETAEVGESACDYVQRMAKAKAQRGYTHAALAKPVLGADTTISVDGQIIGKPLNLADSQLILRQLSGRTHQVLTAVAMVNAYQCQCVLVSTDVQMRMISDDEIIRYWETGEPCDKAGSYAIQGIGGKFITAIHGSYSAVVGLPLVESERLLNLFLSV